MKTLAFLLLAAAPFFLTGCPFQTPGGEWNNRYYNDCKEYYDSGGVYRKDCGGSGRAGASGGEGIGECLNCN